MKSSSGEKIALITAFGAVILSAIIHVGIREWYAPDVRYEKGSYYVTETTAVTSLKLMNLGHQDAEDITINVKFNNALKDISTDNPSLTLSPISGGKGMPFFSGEISRLVPGQEVFVYFAIEYSSSIRDELNHDFISQIVYKGGKASTGRPIWDRLATVSLALLIYVGLFIAQHKYFNKYTYPRHLERINKIIALSDKALKEGDTREEFNEKLDNYLAKISFRKKTLRYLALKLFEYYEEKK